MSARSVKKKRTRLLSRRRLNAAPAGGNLVATNEILLKADGRTAPSADPSPDLTGALR
jgi:hypothetical protein